MHAEELKRLANQAQALTDAGRLADALVAWRTALELLPAGSRQYEAVAGSIAELSQRADAAGITPEAPSPPPSWAARAGALGAVALLFWKLKFVIAFVLTKGKLLLLGLTKGTTFVSMLLSVGVYWTAWGWKFAVGVVASIYVHEMGHVAMLRRFGIPATAPMFIPGIGAVIRSRFYPNEPVAEARVGLAGPIWGLGAAAAAYLAHLATAAPFWAALARFGAWVNLFNLLPVWQLDGGHAFRALNRSQRWIVAAVLAGMWFLTTEGLLVVLALVAAGRAWGGDAPEEGDARTLWEYGLLTVALGALTRIPVP